MQAQRYFFDRWGVEDGLPVATVNQMVQDPLGFIWIGTDGGGIAQFDGKNFRQDPIFQNLPSQFITVLCRDEDRGFWIGTERGMAYFNGRTLDTLIQQPAEMRTRIHAIWPVGKKQAWVATRNGLYFFNGKTFEQPHPEFSSLDIYSLGWWKNNLILAGSAGVFSFSDNKISEIDVSGVQRIFLANGQVYLARQKDVLLLNNDGNTEHVLTADNIRSIIYFDERLWFGSAVSGIYRSASSGFEKIDAANGLVYDRCRVLLAANNGQMWVGSVSGLSKLISPHIVAFDISVGLPDDRIQGLTALPDGTIWGGTASGVFKIADNKVSFLSKKAGFPEGLVLCATSDDNKNIWFGTERGLVGLVNEKIQFFDEKNGLPHSFILSLAWHNGTLYIGTSIGLYAKNKNRFEEIQTEVSEFDEGIRQFFVFGNELFAISLTGHVYQISGNRLLTLTHLLGKNIDTLNIQHILPLSDTSLAIVSNSKALQVWAQKKVVFLGEKRGFAGTQVKSLAVNSSQFWVGTDAGLFVISQKAVFDGGLFRHYQASSGFVAKECNERSIALAPDGKVYVGTNSGLFVFKNQNEANKRVVKPVLTGVDLFYDEFTDWSDYADSTSKWNGVPYAMKLPFDKNYLTFRFTTTQFSTEPVFIRYKLQGQDEEWTQLRNRFEAVFTNIQPGKFEFRLQCATLPDFSDAQEIILPVTIVPPYYRTLWFWTLILGVTSALAIAFVRYRFNQLNQRLQLEAALAESERKALRLQMNPHFVFNAMDAIGGFIFKNEPKEAVRYLSSFAKLMRITLESSREHHVPLQSEIQLLKNYIELEQLRFNNSFQYEITEADEVDPYELQLAPMVLQPFVENAILHGLRHRNEPGGLLKIHFETTDKNLICTIEDNGIGRAKSAEINAKKGKKSLATAITQERIELLAKSRGDKVDFSITDLINPDKSPAGTCVVVVFPLLLTDDIS